VHVSLYSGVVKDMDMVYGAAPLVLWAALALVLARQMRRQAATR
jgi:hypothetical protein